MTITTNKATYTVVPAEDRRVTKFVDGKAIWETKTRYDICLDGKMVQFCYDETQINEMIRFFEEGDKVNPVYFTGLTAG